MRTHFQDRSRTRERCAFLTCEQMIMIRLNGGQKDGEGKGRRLSKDEKEVEEYKEKGKIRQ